MPQEDYIKKEIDKLGKLLAKALADLVRLKSKGQLSDALNVTDQTLRTELGIDLEALCALPQNELLPFLAAEKKLSNVQMELIADLLFESAENDPAAVSKYTRALRIYEAVTETEPNYSINRHFKIELIRRLLREA
ncbi:MAG: hypothetical protein JWO09_328 [Bacteroidetes bacterium]|nr:hypothetical protein [Bacteroidota bacterium]